MVDLNVRCTEALLEDKIFDYFRRVGSRCVTLASGKIISYVGSGLIFFLRVGSRCKHSLSDGCCEWVGFGLLVEIHDIHLCWDRLLHQYHTQSRHVSLVWLTGTGIQGTG